jgi:hypothetical protein
MCNKSQWIEEGMVLDKKSKFGTNLQIKSTEAAHLVYNHREDFDQLSQDVCAFIESIMIK